MTSGRLRAQDETHPCSPIREMSRQQARSPRGEKTWSGAECAVHSLCGFFLERTPHEQLHRLLRSKGQVHSILDDIPGIGPTRRKELMRHFQGIDDIKAATVEELSGLPGMNKKAAEQVYTFFHAPAQEENEDSSK